MKRALAIGVVLVCVAGVALAVWSLARADQSRAERLVRGSAVGDDRETEAGPGESPGAAGGGRTPAEDTEAEPPPGVIDLDKPVDPEEQAKKLAELRPAEGVVTGKVLVKGGPTPSGVQVTLKGGEGEFVGQTDDEGRFGFEGVPPGSYELVAEHPTFPPRRLNFRMVEAHGAGPFEVTLKPPAPPPGVVEGAVSQVEGQIVPEASVALRKEKEVFKGQKRFVPISTERTDALGEFRFDGLKPGRFELVVSHEKFAPHKILFDLDASEGAGPFEIQLKPGGALRIRVLGAWDVPIPDQEIKIESREALGADPIHGRTDAAGAFLVEHLPPGSYWIQRLEVREEVVERKHERGTSRSVRRTEHGPQRVMTVAEGRTTEVLFEASCGMEGSVFGPDGEPLKRVVVRLVPVDLGKDGYRNVQTYTDGEGRYELHGFPAGKYKVSVQTFGERSYVVPVGRLTFVMGEVLHEEIRIPASSISGRLTAADTGKPFDREQEGIRWPSVQARLVKVEDGEVAEWLGKHLNAYPDKDGHFRFVGLEPGHYWMWAPSPSDFYRDATRIVDFTAGGKLDGIDLRLKPRKVGTLSLTVLEPDGTPATGVSFSLSIGPSSSRSLHGKETGDGSWDFPLEEGPREVCVFRRGFEVEVVKLPVTAGETIERTVKLRVREEPQK
jgi:hypothetical protein